MSQFEQIIKNKSWEISKEAKSRLSSLVEKFLSDECNSQYQLIDIEQFSSYFVTHVYKLVLKKNGRKINYFAKLAYLPKEFEKRQRERIKYEFDYTQLAFDAFKKSEKFSSVEPVVYYESEAAFVMKEMHGERLDELLIKSMKSFSSRHDKELFISMRNAGCWLKYFQQNMPAGDKDSLDSTFLENRVIAYIERINGIDSEVLSTDFSTRLIDKTKLLLDEFSTQDFVGVTKHNDFAPWNLMKSGSGIIGFDYADCEFDSKYYDVYHYVRALKSFNFKLIKNTNTINECQNQFLEGYGLNFNSEHPTKSYFDIFFSLERINMLMRARVRNKGLVGQLKTISQRRHFNAYIGELKQIVNM